MDNKTLIYCSVFFNKAYLNLFKLLMCSIKFYTDYEKYDFLLLTSEDYANDVKQISDLVDIPIKTHFLDINSFFQKNTPQKINSLCDLIKTQSA